MWSSLGILLLAFCAVSTSGAKKHKKSKEKEGNKKQVIVLPPHGHKSSKNSEFFVFGHGAGSGQSEEEQIDKETVSSLSSNMVAATNLMRSQSEIIQALSKQVNALRTAVDAQAQLINAKRGTDVQEFEEIKAATKNTTDIVSELASLWSKSEKKYSSKVKGLKRTVNKFEVMLEDLEVKWQKRFAIMYSDLKQTRESVIAIKSTTKNKSEWPSGRYCILANSECPAGFTRQQSFVKAMYLYATTNKFVSGGRIGSSYIGCYGDRCGQYGNYGVVNIVGCCK
ncbi:predicted protein [Nematostella vectensis]|uniref:Uncharacterized protein n=1 Tax=Nematostella vectensis TaxID=45351 RepID=A7SJH9_NEMVE|nr:predicted protein [Nematostella vectensis]|eukprot:XP_001628165.1 predicted protein [Nematostella vectensis]